MLKQFSAFLISLALAWNSPAAAAPAYKLAVIYPGAVQDKDYNIIGYQAMQHVGEKFGIRTGYTQRVAVSEARQAIRRHIDGGYNIIWTHGGQYNDLVIPLCREFPETIFIIEGDEPPETARPNLIVLGGRNYHKSYYVLGALAARLTRTGHVGYIGGLELPFTYGEINAAGQALRQYRPGARLHHLYAGDFNDPLRTRLVAEALIARGCDIFLSGVNLGNFGLFEAVRTAPRKVFFTTTYTSKSGYAPDHYLCSDQVSYLPPLEKAIGDILTGRVRSGYYPVEWGPDKARYISFPIRNISDRLNREIREIAEQVADGTIAVPKIPDRIVTESREPQAYGR